MPVLLKLKGPPSNKPGQIDLKKIAYRPEKGHIAVLKPIIDKISITYPIDDSDLRDTLIESLVLETEKGHPFGPAPKFVKGSVQYKGSALLATPSGKGVLIQIGPKKANVVHGLRLEFNPAAVGPEGIAFLKDELEALVPIYGLKYQNIVEVGNVTRLDIAVDIVGVRIELLDIQISGGGKQHWWLSSSGMLETAYFGMKGTKDKNAPWAAYDKRLQLKEAKDFDGKQLFGGMSQTRIEFHDTPSQPVTKLHARPNPFEKISVAYAVGHPPQGVQPYDWAFFLDACHRRGHAAALNSISDLPTRNKYETALKGAHQSFWKPAEIWKHWPDTIQLSGILQAK